MSEPFAGIDIDDDDAAVRAMTELVERLRDEPAPPIDVVLEAATHARPRVRQAAIRVLGVAAIEESDGPRVVECLLAATRDDASMVVTSACESLGVFARAELRETIVARLLELLDTDLGVAARENVVGSLARAFLDSPPPRAVREAVRRETAHASPEVAAMARWASTRFDEAEHRAPDPEPGEIESLTVEEAETRLRDIDRRARGTARSFYGSMAMLVVAIAVAPASKPFSAAMAMVALALFFVWSSRKKKGPEPGARMRAQLALDRARAEAKRE